MTIKVITFLGTRPEIIRLTPTIKLLDQFTHHTLVHTGQNFHPQLSEVFFQDLSLRNPDIYLNIASSSFASFLADLLLKSEKLLLEQKPDAILILGDTNSALVSIVAKRLQIPIYHMEAGNRSFDLNVPEEVNRKLVDVTADFNLVYTNYAKQNLISEGFPPRDIFVIGSPLCELLSSSLYLCSDDKVLTSLGLVPNQYFLLSLHRQETVNDPILLEGVIKSLHRISMSYNYPFVVSLHPRTESRLTQASQSILASDNFIVSPPFCFSDYINLQRLAFCVLSDSGSIAEEAAILNFPAVTIRRSMERPEALDTASLVLGGIGYDSISSAIRFASHQHSLNTHCPADYTIKNTSFRVVNTILSTHHLHRYWHNLV